MTNNTDLPTQRAKLSPAKRALLEKRLHGELENTAKKSEIRQRSATEPAELSFGQQRLWFLCQLDPASPAYNMHEAVRLTGPLDVAALERSLNEVIRRHDILRTTFTVTDSKPVQVISPSRTSHLPTEDLTGLIAAEQVHRVQQLTIEAARQPFDLTQGPLMRTKLVKLDGKHHIMILITHHIISDEWSSELFWQELADLYEAITTQKPPPLPALPVQYADYAHWQRQLFEGTALAEQLPYWKQQLSGELPLLQLPTDHPRPPSQSFQGALQTLTLPAELTRSLKQINRQAGTTMFMTLMAAFVTLLHRYTGQSDLIVGTPIANRGHSETKALIGLFLNTLAIRAKLVGNPTFLDLLEHIRQVALDAYAHQEFPFEKLVEELQPARSASHNPIFQVMFVFQQKTASLPDLPGLKFNALDLVDTGTAKFDLTLFVIEAGDRLEVAFEYSTDLYEPETVSRMLGHFQMLLAGIVAEPQQPVSELPLLTDAERNRVLVEWNDTRLDYPRAGSIHHLFEAQAGSKPETVAIQIGQTGLTYEELNQRANKLAHHLRTCGVGPGVLVGVCLERSVEMMVAILGVLKAGGAYVPLDPGYPKDRLAFMIQDTQTPVILARHRYLANLPDHNAELILLEPGQPDLTDQPGHNPTSNVSPGDPAYVIYTSGSTGRPKGVLVSHQNLVHSTSIRFHYYPEPVDKFLLLSSFTFDSSAVGIFWTLCQGGTLVLPPPRAEQDVHQLASLIAANRITHMLGLPVLYRLLLEETDVSQLTSLRTVIVAGEECPKSLVTNHFQYLPETTLYNEYGPSEATVWSTVYKVPATLKEARVPIGRPIANMQTYILDPQRQPVPIGVPGELYIGGDGLARGYLNLPELTEEKFGSYTIDHQPARRLYQTGDLARYRPGGDIEFLGRIDHQLKIRGFRVELGEIETVLGQHPAVRESVVVVRDVSGTAVAEAQVGDKRLTAYVVYEDVTPPKATELRQFLQESLPDFMVPAYFIALEKLPLTANGKVDRKSLPDPKLFRSELEQPFVAPRTVIETTLAEIWTEVLGLEKVGIYDNFFELGGHSLLIIKVVSRMQSALQIQIPLQQFFDTPTIAALADTYERMKENHQASTEMTIARVSRGSYRRKRPSR